MKESLQHIFSLGVKELIGIGRDPLLVILIIYSFTVSIYLSATSEPDTIENAAIAIVDEDHSALSKRLSDAFMPPMFLPPVSISREDIDPLLDNGTFTFVVVFPPNFQERVLADHRPEIQLNVDATRMTQAFTGNGYIQEILMREINKFIRENSDNEHAYTAEPVLRNRFNPNLTNAWNGAINGLISNIAMIALVLTGAALIRERERGTLEHLLVTPVNPIEIMIAKIWSMSLIVLVATIASLIAVIQHMMAVPIAGSITLFAVGCIINLFAITSMGIFLACYAKDMPQLGILIILVLMPMDILSGGKTSQGNMPFIIRMVMMLAPTTYFVKFSQAILFRGAEFILIWKIFLQMFLLGCVYFIIALLRFRKTVAS